MILISTPYLPCRQQVVTSNTGPILVFPRSNPSVQMYLRLLAKCTHDRPLNLWIVRILQCLLSWSTVRLQQQSGILHPYKICSICLVVITFQFVLHIFAIVIVQRHVCVDHMRHERGTRLFSHNGSSRVIGFIFFTHFCDCTVKTELIYRSNCAKNSCNRFLVGTIVDRQFSTAFAFELTSGQWTRGSKDWMSAFSECDHHQFSHFVPFTLWTIFTDRIPLSLNQDREMTIVLLRIFFANGETSWAFDSHSFLLSFDPQEMSLNIDMKIIRPVKFSGVSLNLNSKSWTLWLSCNVVNPGKIFHSNSIGSPSICPSVLYSGELLNHANLSSHAVFVGRFSLSYQDTIQNLKIRKPSRALKTDDLFITNQR